MSRPDQANLRARQDYGHVLVLPLDLFPVSRVMASDKSYAHGAELKEDTNPFDATTSPKYHKKESKGYVAFHSDSNESSDGEKCEDEFRYNALTKWKLKLKQQLTAGDSWH